MVFDFDFSKGINGTNIFSVTDIFTFTFTEFVLSKATKLTISTVCVFPGNWTHNLLCCWRNALPLSHRNTYLLITHPSEHRSSHWDLSSWLWEKCLESQWSSGDPQHRGLKIQARDQTVRSSQVQYTWRCECGFHENQGQRSSCFHRFLELKAQHINNNHVRVNVCVCWNRNSLSSCVRRRRGELRGPSPGVVKQSTEVKYSENFFKPLTWPTCTLSWKFGRTVTIFISSSFPGSHANS